MIQLSTSSDHAGSLYVLDEHAERYWIPQCHAQAVKTMLARHLVYGSRGRLAVRLTIAFRLLFARIARYTSTTVSGVKDRRLAPETPQNSNSGAFWYPLVPSGTFWLVGNAGFARRFYVRPAAHQGCPQ